MTENESRSSLELHGFDVFHQGKWRLGSYLVMTAFAFVLAKSLATEGSVTIDQFEYWVLGLMPIVFYAFIASYKRDRNEGALLARLASWAALGWSVSLLLYDVLQGGSVFGDAEFRYLSWLGYNWRLLDGIASVVCALLGTLVAHLMLLALAGGWRASGREIVLGGMIVSSLNALFFFALVFLFTLS